MNALELSIFYKQGGWKRVGGGEMKGEGEGRLRLSIAKPRFSHVISS